jgi:hypothetical protein
MPISLRNRGGCPRPGRPGLGGLLAVRPCHAWTRLRRRKLHLVPRPGSVQRLELLVPEPVLETDDLRRSFTYLLGFENNSTIRGSWISQSVSYWNVAPVDVGMGGYLKAHITYWSGTAVSVLAWANA